MIRHNNKRNMFISLWGYFVLFLCLASRSPALTQDDVPIWLSNILQHECGSPTKIRLWYFDGFWCDWYRYTDQDGWYKVNQSAVPHPDDSDWHLLRYDNPARLCSWGLLYRWVDGEIEVLGQEAVEPPAPEKPQEEDADSKEPINTISGYMHREEIDVVIPCPGLSLEFERAYNSGIDYTNGPLGPRWSHTYDWGASETSIVVTTIEENITNDVLEIRTGGGETISLSWMITNHRWQCTLDNGWRAYEATNSGYDLYLPGCILYAFDSNGVLQSISEQWNNELTLTYTNSYPTQLLSRVEHNNGQYLDFTYQSNMLVTLNTPSTNFTISYSYNDQDELTNVTRSTSSGNFSTTYAYDSVTNWHNHSLTQRVNAAGDVFSYGYATNSSGQISSQCTNMVLGASYYKHTLAHYTDSDYARITYERSGTNQWYDYYYNPDSKRLDRLCGPNSTNIVRSYDYDTHLNVTEEKLENISLGEYIITETVYDPWHNVSNQAKGYCAAANNEWIYSWDTNYTVLTSITDPEGHVTEYEYTNGLLSKAKLYYDASNSFDTLYSYTTNGLLSCATNANGHWVKYTYDSYGFPATVEPQTGPTVTCGYSQLGHLTNISLPGAGGNRVTVFDPDELGRVTSITYPNSLSETFLYDSLGNLTNHMDTVGRTTRYTYLPTRKLSSITRTLNGTNITTSFDYDQQFNTLTIKDPKNRVVEAYALDIQDRPTTITNVEGQVMTVNYGVANYVKSVTRFDGTIVSNTYNTDGLLSEVKYPDSTSAFTYYKNNLLKTAGNEIGTISNAYNFANRLASQTSVQSVLLSVRFLFF